MEKNAYTLIEILIVISITAILLGFGFAGFRQYSQRQVLFTAAREVRSDLRLLQEKAISGVKEPDVITSCAGKFLDGYRFDIISTTQYRMSAVCSGSVVNIQDKSVKLGFTIAATIDPILFKVLSQGTDITGSSSIITLTQTATNKNITITVSAEGSIE
ncbi:MAG: prepilin-type N-terminal cleavage/methylation domain-containing protein [bacterium]